MELAHIVLIIIFSILLGEYMAYLWLNGEVKRLKTLRYGDIKGIMIRDERINKLKQQIKELELFQHQISKEEESNKSNIND